MITAVSELLERDSISESEQRAVKRGWARPTAETAECTCPDFCERDHDND
ncbi:MAG: hypothetical protein ACRDKK_04075 [Gaiellaceae bacterium]